MTITDLPTEATRPDATQVLFQEAKRRRRRRWFVSGIAGGVVVALVLTLSFKLGSGGRTGNAAPAGPVGGSVPPTYPTGPDIAYVFNASGWIPFNLIDHSTSTPIRLMGQLDNSDDPIGSNTWDVVVAPGATLAYGAGTSGIVPIDLRTGSVGKPISRIDGCQSISTGGSGQTLYVAGCGEGYNGFKTIVPVSAKTGAVGTPIRVPGGPLGVFVSPDGRTAYAVTNRGATLSPVNLATGVLGRVIVVPNGVSDFAISPDGTMGYATGTHSDGGVGPNGTGQYTYITPINLKTGQAEQPIALLHDPLGIVLSPDGRSAYVTGGNYGSDEGMGSPDSPNVTEISLDSGRVEATFKIAGGAGTIFNETTR